MQQTIGKSDPGNFSDDELNPLLNPLLAANMGRWAEVYCTNPPERRDRAVIELIHELQTSARTKNPAAESPTPAITRPVQPTLRVSISPPSASSDIVCAACGEFNPEGQKFCGMCGSPLAFRQQVPERDQARSHAGSSRDAAPPFSSYTEDADEDHDADEGTGFAERSNPFEFQAAAQEDLPSFAREVAPTPYRYRLYLGGVLAIMLAALFYWARFRTEIHAGNQDAPAAGSTAAAEPNPAPSKSVQSAPAENVEKNEDPAQALHKPNQPPVTASQQDVATRQGKANPPSPNPVLAASNAAAVSTAANGSEERAEAQKYLSGNARDGGEAAQWLWKAVAKGNGSSAVELADLYLRGDGVAKNCDQGRLLLDVAAKKGIKGATIQLQNLQAFGCR